MNLQIPHISNHVIDFSRSLACSWIGYVPVVSKPHCKEWDCHNNTLKYVDWYGGQRILGYYLLECASSNKLCAILHSIVRRPNQTLIDITPFSDERNLNLFVMLKNQTSNYNHPEVWNSQETEISSYRIGDTKMDITENTFSGLTL
jgi:hypothetical protein